MLLADLFRVFSHLEPLCLDLMVNMNSGCHIHGNQSDLLQCPCSALTLGPETRYGGNCRLPGVCDAQIRGNKCVSLVCQFILKGDVSWIRPTAVSLAAEPFLMC